MFGRQDLRSLGVNLSIANPNLIDAIHQLGDEIKIETGAAKGRNLSFGRDNHLRVFNCVIEIVLSDHSFAI